MMKQETHRPGAFKQSNKRHKTGRHRSKSAVDNGLKGELFCVRDIGISCSGNIKIIVRFVRTFVPRIDILSTRETIFFLSYISYFFLHR